MLHLHELEKLRRDRHKAALAYLLKSENWHVDARKCIEVKLTEWALESGTAADTDEDEDEDDVEEVHVTNDKEEVKEVERVEERNETEKELEK